MSKKIKVIFENKEEVWAHEHLIKTLLINHKKDSQLSKSDSFLEENSMEEEVKDESEENDSFLDEGETGKSFSIFWYCFNKIESDGFEIDSKKHNFTIKSFKIVNEYYSLFEESEIPSYKEIQIDGKKVEEKSKWLNLYNQKSFAKRERIHRKKYPK